MSSVNEKKLPLSDMEGGETTDDDGSLLMNFAMETTAHGVVKIATARTTIKKVFWVIALLGAFVLSATMISLRFKAYFDYNTVVEYNTEYPNELTFPAVTFCNFNKLKSSYMEGENGKALSFLNDMLSEALYDEVEDSSGGCSCGPDEFKCVDDFATCCIPISWHCDEVTDCSDNSDETVSCSMSEFNELPEVPFSAVWVCGPVLVQPGDVEDALGLSRQGGWIISEGFSIQNYNNNLDCDKVIPAGNQQYLVLHMWYLIEDGDGCPFDSLSVGPERYCGSSERHMVYSFESNPQQVPVKFRSDGSVNLLGFAVKWYYSDNSEGLTPQLMREACEIKVTSSYSKSEFDVQPPVAAYYAPTLCNYTQSAADELDGWFASDNFGHFRYTEEDCAANIAHQNMTYLILDIWLSLEIALPDCRYDRLMIGSLPLCGVMETSVAVELSSVINSNDDVITFRFIADSAVHDKGYAFHWRLSNSPEGHDVVHSNCDLTYEEPPSSNQNVSYTNIVSPVVDICNHLPYIYPISTVWNTWLLLSHNEYMGSAQHYSNDQNCSITFDPGPSEVTLNFQEIGIDGTAGNCLTDYVKIVVGGTNRSEEQTFCGMDVIPVNLTIPEHTQFTVSFVTDSADTHVGFSLVIRTSSEAAGVATSGYTGFGYSTRGWTNSITEEAYTGTPTWGSESTAATSTTDALHSNSSEYHTNTVEFSTNDPDLTTSVQGLPSISAVYTNNNIAPSTNTIGSTTISPEYTTEGGSISTTTALTSTGTSTSSFSVTPQGSTVVTVMSSDLSTSPTMASTSDSSAETTTDYLTTSTAAVAGRRKRRAVNRDLQLSPFAKLRPARTRINVYEAIRNRRAIYQTQRKDDPQEESTNKTLPVTSTQQTLDLTGTQFSAMILEGGWQLENGNTLLECTYRGIKCKSEWFKHVFTRFGNCYTFNAENWLNTSEADIGTLELPLKQIQAGPAHGLSVKLDIKRGEYAENLDTGYPQVGVKFQVHTPGTPPDVENQGLAIGAGKHGYVGFRIAKVLNIEPPWGKCDRTKRLKWSDVYSFEQCAVECKLDYVVEECGCKPFYYPGDEVECTAAQLKNCALAAIARMDHGKFAEVCRCPASCEYDDVDMKLSYTEFGSAGTTVTEMNQKYYNISDDTDPADIPDQKFYQENIVSMDIYFDAMSYTVLKQLKAMDESSLLSDLGGQLGLFIGVSVLTICEMLETVVMACYKCYRGRRSNRVLDKWAHTVQKIQVQSAAGKVSKDDYVISMT